MQDTIFETGASFDAAMLAQSFASERPADIAEALDALDAEEAAAIVAHLPPELAVDALEQSGIDGAEEIIALLPRAQGAALLDAMSADRAADMFRAMEEPARTDLLALVQPEVRDTIHGLLAYPEGSVGAFTSA